MYKIGLSTCGKIIGDELFKNCADAGIDVLEISPPQGHYDEVDYGLIEKLSKAYGVGIWSLHLPYYPFAYIDLSSPDKEIRTGSARYLGEVLGKGAAIGIDKFVVHPSGEPLADDERGERMQASKESLSALADIAAENGAVIAVEDLPRTCLGNCSDEILELLSVDERLRACFDTNHLLNERAVDFIRAIGKRIVTLHVSDYDKLNERHWLPGEGKQDWAGLYSALGEVGYDGPWLYEIAFEAPGTIIRERDLTCSDFVKNAREIFASIPPTPLGRPKEGLTSWK